MNIAEIIAALQRGEDPSTAIPGAFAAASPDVTDPMGARQGIPHLQSGGFPFPPSQAQPPAAAPTQAPPQQQAPVGQPTPVTNPQPPGASPNITQSPPDLANMYLELMKQNQNARALDSGMTLIAAGLSPYQASRTALIGLAGQEGKEGRGVTSADLINLQKARQDAQNLAVRRAALPALAERHKIDPNTIQFLEASGKLDEVIQNFMTQNLVHIKDDKTGATSFYNGRTGEKIVDIGGGLKPTDVQQNMAAANAERVARGEPPLTTEEFISTVHREPPAADDITRLAVINKERLAAGKPPMTMEELLVIKHPKTEVNVSPDGTTYPKPPPGFDYKRIAGGPDNGKVWINPATQLPEQVAVGPKAEAETRRTEQQVVELEQKEIERQKKENRAKITAAAAATNVGAAVDSALVNATRLGASGAGSRISRAISPGGLPSDTLDANLATVTAQATVQAINEMRAASPTGAALGNVSDFENRMLASTIANVSPHQETEQLKANLIRIKAMMMVMGENRYEDGDAAKFNKDLKERMEELTKAEIERSTATKGRPGIKVQRVPRE